MNRAQKRDAVHQQKFYFRKDVFPAGRNMDFPCTTPVPSSDGEDSPCSDTKINSRPAPCGEVQAASSPHPCSEANVNGFSLHAAPLGKENALRNCYPDVEPVTLERMPVDEEYEEMTINEIINGKVYLTAELEN